MKKWRLALVAIFAATAGKLGWKRWGSSTPTVPRSWSRAVIVGPAYDPLTRLLAPALARLAATHFREDSHLLGDQAGHVKLRDWLESSNDHPLIVFVGHGMPDGLLTSPSLACSVCTTNEGHGYLLHHHHLARPASVMAICCHAGAGFGPDLATSQDGASFIGYDEEIYFLGGSQERVDAVLSPTVRLLDTVIREGALRKEHAARLREWYEAERFEWLHGPRADREEAAAISMCLDNHAQRLIYGGP